MQLLRRAQLRLASRNRDLCLATSRPLIWRGPTYREETKIFSRLHKHVLKVAPQIPNSTYSQNVLLTRIGCQILDLSQAIPQRQAFTVEIVVNPRGRPVDQWNTRERKCRKPPPSPLPAPATELYHGLPASKHTLPGRAGSIETVQRVQRRKPNTAGTRVGRSRNDTTINPMRNPNTWRNINRGQERDAKQTPSAGLNPNTGGSRNLGRNSNC